MKRITSEQIIRGINCQKWAWVDKQLKKVLPPARYVAMHRKDPDAIGWVKEQGYHIQEDGDVISVMKGCNVIARTRLVLELKTPEELDMLVKVANVKPPSKIIT